jgi:dipeptidyl aminopeptidase/acylaminoacyl peptidase
MKGEAIVRFASWLGGRMSKWLCAFRAALIFALSISGQIFPASATPPVEVFGNLPVITDARISPDGKHLAVIRPINGRPAVTVFELDSPNAKPKDAAFPDAIADRLYWANNNRLICIFHANLKQTYSSDIDQFTRAISVAMDGGNAVVLMGDAPKQNNWQSGVVDQNPADSDHVLMETAETDDQLHAGESRTLETVRTMQFVATQYYLDVFNVDVATGEADIIAHGTPNTVRFVMDGAGHPIARIDQGADLKAHLFLGTREVVSYDVRGGSKMDVAGVMGDGGTLGMRAVGKDGFEALYGLNLENGTLGPAIFMQPGHDVRQVLADDHNARIIGASYVDDLEEYKYFDSAREQIEEKLKRALPGQSVELVSRDASGANYVVRAEGPKNPTGYYMFSPAASQLSLVASAYPTLTSADLGEERAYPYKSRDGLDIRAYLTLPPGKLPKNLPTVIFPHGGPADRDELGFDFWAQFMASRGYAVLQPNFRGSSGYGTAFRDAGDGEWAGKVQNDIADGVQKLIADGISDPKRICIVGASYGGYAALAGATFNPDMYACAISYAGLSDLQLMLERNVFYGGEETESSTVWEKRIGAGKSDTEKLDSMSPYAHADRVKIPILLIHSSRDITVPIEQSEIENKALQKAGKNVEFIKLDGDDHYLSLGETRIRLLKEVERFLAAHIGN